MSIHNRFVTGIIFVATTVALCGTARAQSYWTNSAAGLPTWNTAANWTNTVPVQYGSVSTILNFSVPGTYTSSNNWSGIFTNNGLVFGAGTVTLAGGQNAFLNNGATLPVVTNFSGNLATIRNALALATNVTFTGPNDITVAGILSGAGSLIKDSVGTLLVKGATATYTGATIVNGGALSLSNSIATSTSMNIASGATVNVLGGNLPGNNWTIAGTLNKIDGSYQLVPNPVTLNNGTITGGADNTWGVFVLGGGTITANGANNTISAYKLGMANGTTNTFSTPNATDALTISSPLGSTAATSGSLVKTGSGLLTLSSANTYTGATIVNGGTLNLNGIASSSSISIGAGATLNQWGVNSLRKDTWTISGTLSRADGLSQDIFGSVTLNNGTLSSTSDNSNNWGNFVLGGGTITANGANNTINAVRLGMGGFTFNTPNATDALTISSILGTSLAKAGNLVKTGAGTLTLSGVNIYTGATTISAGTLAISGAGQLNSGAYAAAISDDGVFVYNSSAAQTLSGVISGNGSLIKTNTSTLTLTGANTYTGTTTVAAGTLLVSGGGALSGTTNLTVDNGGNFSYQPTTTGTVLALGTGSTLNLNDGSAITLAWNTTTANVIKVLGAATVGTGSGVSVSMGGTFNSGTSYTILQAASGLDTGNYRLLNASNYTGTFTKATTQVQITPKTATVLTAAYWKGAGSSSLKGIWATSVDNDGNWANAAGANVQGLVPGSGADVFISATSPTVAPTATTLGANMTIKSLTIQDTINGLGLNADGNTLTIMAGGITVSNNVPASMIGANVALGASQTWSNNSANGLAVTGAVSGAFSLTVAGAGNTTISGVLGTGAGNLAKIGGGALTLSGANTYSGITSNNAGTLVFSNATALGTGNITFGGGTLKYGTGFTPDLSGRFRNSKLGPIAIDDNGQALTYASAIDSSNTNGLTKAGAGTLTLSAANTYGGGTTVNNGTLMLYGSLTGAVTMAAGTTLGGTGVVAGVVTNTGTMTPGTTAGTIGTLTVTNLVVNPSASFVWDYDTRLAQTNDLISMSGNLTLPTVATVTVNQVSGKLPNPGVLITGFTNTPSTTDLNGWVIKGAGSTTRAKVFGNQVVLSSSKGCVLYVQ